MRKQKQIKRTPAWQESIEAIRHLLSSNAHGTRSSLAHAVCTQFGFLNARGVAQSGGCVKALQEVERAGHLVLLASSHTGVVIAKKPRRLEAPREVPAKAWDVRGLRLIRVETTDQMRMWNEMRLCEHPQGAGPLVGAQMRYLIGSEHGSLEGGGLVRSVGAAACGSGHLDWLGRGYAP